MKALVAVEPAVAGDISKAAALKNIPVLMVFGDYIGMDSRWSKMRAADLDFAQAVRNAGGSVDVVNLPETGIKGNSHMMMMDKNNGAIADLIQKQRRDRRPDPEMARRQGLGGVGRPPKMREAAARPWSGAVRNGPLGRSPDRDYSSGRCRRPGGPRLRPAGQI